LSQVPADRSADVFIVRPDSVFVNGSDSTYFAIPRYRIELLLAKADLSDSLEVGWKRDYQDQESNLFLWRSAAYVFVVATLLEFLIIIWR